MGDVNELKKERNKTMANLPGSIKNLNTLLGEQLLEGGGSGGGGSSDFSTANVTVIDQIDDEILWTYLPVLQGDAIRTDLGIHVGTTTFTIALYKGSAIVDYGRAGEDVLVTVAVSGNATNDMEGHIIISGDCTLTYSAGLLP